jgi:hypothetical protein
MTSDSAPTSRILISRKFTYSKKMCIVHEACSVPQNISRTSIKWNILGKTIRDWKKVLPKLELEVRKTKLTTHPGPKMKGTHLIPFISNEIQKACKPLT